MKFIVIRTSSVEEIIPCPDTIKIRATQVEKRLHPTLIKSKEVYRWEIEFNTLADFLRWVKETEQEVIIIHTGQNLKCGEYYKGYDYILEIYDGYRE